MGRCICFVGSSFTCATLFACASTPSGVVRDRHAQQTLSVAQPKSEVTTKSDPASTKRFVIVDVAEERLGPSESATITNRVHRGQVVNVYETQSGWARVSGYYQGGAEGQPGRVARWIPMASLGAEPPISARALSIAADPRVTHLPNAPGEGLSERDVLVLHAAARYFLETGKMKRVEGGDKSVRKPDTYYLMEGPQNRFFRSGDIPDLEQRIDALQK